MCSRQRASECVFRCFNDYIGFGTAFSRHKTGIKRTANNVIGNLSSHRHAGRFVDFRSYCGPFRTQSIVGAQLHHRIIGIGRTDIFESIPLLQISIVGIGLGGGILNGETNALVSDISGESEKGSRISFLGVFYGLGALGIPSLLGILSEHYSFETILQGIGIIMLAGILFCIPIRFPAPKQAQGFPVKEGLGLLKESSLLLLSFILFFQSGIEGVCNNWSTSYFGQVTDIPANQGLIALTCMVAGLTVARMLQIVLFKKIQPAKVLPYSLILTATGFALLTAAPGFIRAAAGMAVIGMGLSSTYPVILSILGTRYPSLSGTAFGIALAIALIGQTAMNGLMGMVFTYDNGIVLYPYIMIGSLAIMLVLFKRSLK